MNHKPMPALLFGLLALLAPAAGMAQAAPSASSTLDLSVPRDAALRGYRRSAPVTHAEPLPDLGGPADGIGIGHGAGRGGGLRADLPYGAGYEARRAGGERSGVGHPGADRRRHD